MRSRNREVNIFNMSLLDILTGMLGAFLFLMLGLVPYYTRAHSGNNNNGGSTPQDKEPPISNMLDVTAHWYTPDKLNIYIYNKTHGWSGNNDKNPVLPRGTKVDTAATSRNEGWENASSWVSDDEEYLVVFTVPPTPPTPVHPPTPPPQVPASATSPASTNAPPVPPPTPVPAYAHLGFTVNMLEAQGKANESGVAGFYPDTVCYGLNATDAKPGTAYAAFWVVITKDDTKKEYFQKYDYRVDKVDPTKDHLPAGVKTLPSLWNAF